MRPSKSALCAAPSYFSVRVSVFVPCRIVGICSYAPCVRHWTTKERPGRQGKGRPLRQQRTAPGRLRCPARTTQETSVSVGAPRPDDQRDRPIRRRRRPRPPAARPRERAAALIPEPRGTRASSSSARPARHSPTPAATPQTPGPADQPDYAHRPAGGQVDRVGLLCGWIAGLAIVAIVVLGLAGSAPEAFAAIGGIGAALAVAVKIYLWRRS